MPMDSEYLREQLPELAILLATVAAEKRGDPILHLVQLLQTCLKTRKKKTAWS